MMLILRMIKNNLLQKIVPDYFFIRRRYKKVHGKKLNLKNPTAFTEKIQWLKLYDRSALLTKCADKIEVREYVKTKIGKEYLIPLLYSSRNPETIPYSQLPSRYIIKTNHGSGTNIIVINNEIEIDNTKYDFDKELISKVLIQWMSTNMYYNTREWEYKNIIPHFLIEELIKDETNNDILNDYKIYCFNGQPVYIQTIFDRQTSVKETWYDINWKLLDLHYFSDRKKIIEKPENLDEMINVAKKLAKDFIYVRVDLYSVKNKLFFGELTFHPFGGLMKFHPEEWDYILGGHLKLPIDK